MCLQLGRVCRGHNTRYIGANCYRMCEKVWPLKKGDHMGLVIS
jgi:hypothetical protein